MLYGFEDQTKPMTDYERDTLLPIIVKGLTPRVGVEKAITNADMRKKLNELGYKTSDPRMRKVIHFIRTEGHLPFLCASSKGYWIETDIIEYQKWIKSLGGRIGATKAVMDAAIRDVAKQQQTSL